MKTLDIFLIIGFFILIALAILFVKTVNDDGAKCLTNPNKYAIEWLEQSSKQDNILCSCNIKGAVLLMSKENITLIKNSNRY